MNHRSMNFINPHNSIINHSFSSMFFAGVQIHVQGKVGDSPAIELVLVILEKNVTSFPEIARNGPKSQNKVRLLFFSLIFP